MTQFLLQKKSVLFFGLDKPVNYLPKKLPPSQDLNPLMFETTALYGIKKFS